MYRFDMYEREEFNPSWATQLDVCGMQPHSREFLEYETLANRSIRKFETVDGQTIDYMDGIHFGDTP